jgi:U4/U6.U5 tri-snRNP-associated protein 2
MKRSLDEAYSVDCPYLDTIDRSVLDFDLEKVCSVTLTNINVYCCLCCGKFFQGRGRTSPAHAHALDNCHYLYINLESGKIYSLPDGYEVHDSSLEDIQFVLRPKFTVAEVDALQNKWTPVLKRGVGDVVYTPGAVGLNLLGQGSYLNAVLQALSMITPLRSMLLLHDESLKSSMPLVTALSNTVKRMWSPLSFHGHVSPFELFSVITTLSNATYSPTKPVDPWTFLCWLLRTVAMELRKSAHRSMITSLFEGLINVEHCNGSDHSVSGSDVRPFKTLTLDLPSMPLFKASSVGYRQEEAQTLPQVPLLELMHKFQGQVKKWTSSSSYDLYRVEKYPQYLILHVDRFTDSNTADLLTRQVNGSVQGGGHKNNVSGAGQGTQRGKQKQKNVTIVSFPARNLPLGPHTYDLAANIAVGSGQSGTSWKCYIPQGSSSSQWFEMEDLFQTVVMEELVEVSESFLLIYHRRRK